MPSSDATVTKVAYIGGAGRSGSTVLALLLSRLPGFVAVGGLSNIWERGLRDNYLCGCGTPFMDCSFWRRVGADAFGGWTRIRAEEMIQSKLAVTRYRHLPSHMGSRFRPSFKRTLGMYSASMARLYRSIAAVSGCNVIVDNSHDVMSALLLRQMPNIEGRVIHLVRDSRGVTFSLSKRVLRPEATGGPAYMPQYAPVHASVEWLVGNAPYHLVGLAGLPRMRIRYESLVASPTREMARITEFLGFYMAPAELPSFDTGSIGLGENHMVSGNPHRVGRRSVEVRLDDEWRDRMKVTDRLIVTLLTLPLALAYGYVGNGRMTAPVRSV